MIVSFDLFSALIDSRRGGAAAFDVLAAQRGWALPGTEVYDAWDRYHKAAQRDCREWVAYAELAELALRRAYDDLGLSADARADLGVLLDSMPDWPLWPDVVDGLTALARRHRLGLLSNVDDAVFATTQAAPLIDPEVALTSERLRAYKPDPRIYRRAQQLAAEQGESMVHVASSARDVRGSLEAGIPVVRLSRPGHTLDPEGPEPTQEAGVAGRAGEAVAERPERRRSARLRLSRGSGSGAAVGRTGSRPARAARWPSPRPAPVRRAGRTPPAHRRRRGARGRCGPRCRGRAGPASERLAPRPSPRRG